MTQLFKSNEFDHFVKWDFYTRTLCKAVVGKCKSSFYSHFANSASPLHLILIAQLFFSQVIEKQHRMIEQLGSQIQVFISSQ